MDPGDGLSTVLRTDDFVNSIVDNSMVLKFDSEQGLGGGPDAQEIVGEPVAISFGEYQSDGVLIDGVLYAMVDENTVVELDGANPLNGLAGLPAETPPALQQYLTAEASVPPAALDTRILTVPSSDVEDVVDDVVLLSCPHCSYQTNLLARLESHLRRRHAPDQPPPPPPLGTNPVRLGPLHCSHCDYSTRRSAHLKTHLRTHTGEKPYGCKYCDYRSAYSHDVRDHERAHTGEKPHACDYCHFKCSRLENLKIHLASHLSGTGAAGTQFRCSECDYTTGLEALLNKHKRTTHQTQKPYACTECPYRTSVSASLRVHLKNHSQENFFPCYVCTYSAQTEAGLQKHKIKEHGGKKMHTCTLCSYRTNKYHFLQNHMTKVHKDSADLES